MKYLSRWIVAIMMMTGLSAYAVEPELSAQESVDIYITTLLERIEQIQPLYETERTEYFSEVELALSSFVDFQEVARGVMAKYGTGPNGATPEQLARFTEVFVTSLVDFYGSALATYSGGRFEFLETRRAPKNPEVSTNVRMKIISDDDSSIEVQYTMFLNDARVWKLKNLYIEGINLRRQYHSRFDNLMVNNNYDINSVINRWQVEE